VTSGGVILTLLTAAFGLALVFAPQIWMAKNGVQRAISALMPGKPDAETAGIRAWILGYAARSGNAGQLLLPLYAPSLNPQPLQASFRIRGQRKITESFRRKIDGLLGSKSIQGKSLLVRLEKDTVSPDGNGFAFNADVDLVDADAVRYKHLTYDKRINAVGGMRPKPRLGASLGDISRVSELLNDLQVFFALSVSDEELVFLRSPYLHTSQAGGKGKSELLSPVIKGSVVFPDDISRDRRLTPRDLLALTCRQTLSTSPNLSNLLPLLEQAGDLPLDILAVTSELKAGSLAIYGLLRVDEIPDGPYRKIEVGSLGRLPRTALTYQAKVLHNLLVEKMTRHIPSAPLDEVRIAGADCPA